MIAKRGRWRPRRSNPCARGPEQAPMIGPARRLAASALPLKRLFARDRIFAVGEPVPLPYLLSSN